jgi:His/Glu/Gln/Arg/opine family amino acid ABC transporter permease subunit
MHVIIAQLPRFAAATWLTIWMFAVVTLISTVAGAALAVAADRLGRPVSTPLAIYCWVFRGVPELVVLLACYLALPAAGIDISPIGAALLGLSLIGIAFLVEIFRGGLAAIDRRQIEAARSLGMSWRLAMRRIVLPQVVRIVLPAWTTFLAGFVKAFAVTSAIAVIEVMALTRQLIAISNQPFLLILFASAIYAAIASVLMIAELLLARRFARRYGLGRRMA